jgi:hypothetical protein
MSLVEVAKGLGTLNAMANMVAMKSLVNASPSPSLVRLGIREIADADIDPVINLLARGFPSPRRYWEAALRRLRTRSLPPNMPRYGYVLEADGNPVGVILSISSLRYVGDREELFSNLSGWYVEPGFRSHATQLFKRALANRHTTYLNVSAAAHIRPIIEAFGFRRYSEGQILTPLALARNRQNTRVRIVGVDSLGDSGLEERERRLLKAQARYGCIAFCCTAGGQARPFVFVPRVIKGVIPCAQLAYCRNITDLADVAGTVGRHLLRNGRPFVLIDANGPIPGIPGKYFPDVAPKYYKGATPPVLGDLTETEATIFGFASGLRAG